MVKFFKQSVGWVLLVVLRVVMVFIFGTIALLEFLLPTKKKEDEK